MAHTAALQAETGLTRYFEEIWRFPMLERQQEAAAVIRRYHQCRALRSLVSRHICGDALFIRG